MPFGVAVRPPASATLSGPRNSSVIVRPSPIRSIATYTARFMTTNTEASSITGTHCLRVNSRNRGRPTASRIAAATHWRIATTATGPITGNASAPIAAPD